MTDTITGPPRSGRRQGRTALLAAAAAGAVTVVIATGVNLIGADRGTPAPTGGTGTAAASSPAPDRRDELTTGPLMPTSNPVRISIPALGVTSALIGLGLDGAGAMQVPDNADTVGWFTRAPTPGALGPAVLAGHVNWKGRDGAFATLDTVTAGDEVVVARADGTAAVFAVTRVQRYPKDRFPTDDVYGPIDHAGLRLITCGGEFDASRHSYRDNVVVFAALTRAA